MTDTRFMDFDAARAETEADTAPEKFSFRLCGRDWHVTNEVAGVTLMDFFSAGRVSEQLGAGRELLLAAVVEDEREAFTQMLRHGQPGVPAKPAVKANKALGVKAQRAEDAVPAFKPPTMEQLDNIIAWFVRELLGRPTTPA